MNNRIQANGFTSVLVSGGGGYVGSALVPALLERGYQVKVVDLFWFGHDVLSPHPRLEVHALDLRDRAAVAPLLAGVDAVIHLACISNDPSFELDPGLGRSINYDAFGPLVQAAVDGGVRRFIYASSSSIYGVQPTPNVREDATPNPLTDYSRFKLLCEHDLLAHSNVGGMERVIIRPATVCGYAPRLRLDLVVNILTAHALVERRIRVFGGKQLRPNICIDDMVRAYLTLLDAPGDKVDRQAFNAGYQNHTVEELALIIRDTIGDSSIQLEYVPSDDNRSYHINSDKIRDVLGFVSKSTIADAVRSLMEAFAQGKVKDPLSNPLYSNIKTMKRVGSS